MSYWRDRARPIIQRVLDETEGQDEKAIKLALRDAYPFGPRQYHPYKMWLKEIKSTREARAKLAAYNAQMHPDPEGDET